MFTVLRLLNNLLSLKTDVNVGKVISKSKLLFIILKAIEEKIRIRIREIRYGSVAKNYVSVTW
jgi:hypothetical protein